MKFFRCSVCGQMVGLLKEGGGELTCCGQPMELLAPGTDGAEEKHLPVVTVTGGDVSAKIGSTVHPMLEEHHIEWIYLKTTEGGRRKKLGAGSEPEAVFSLADGEKAVAVYAYCNLHGLWAAEL